MKRSVKKLGKIALLGVAILFTTTGCKSDDMEDIEIITTNYPNEYIIEREYGNHAKITNIYPDGVDVNNYKPIHIDKCIELAMSNDGNLLNKDLIK